MAASIAASSVRERDSRISITKPKAVAGQIGEEEWLLPPQIEDAAIAQQEEAAKGKGGDHSLTGESVRVHDPPLKQKL